MTDTRIITIMGSGETSPTMVKTHRELLHRLGPKARAVVLDTPYGFQANATELAQRAVEYFAQSVGHSVEIAGLTRMKQPEPAAGFLLDEVAVEQGLNRVRTAEYVFAGPGSPTYALAQWSGTPLPEILSAKLRSGGVVTFSSAAALTLGRFTVPVYEIYKVGVEPHWLDGLDVLANIGLNVAIIPHFDNAEGGHHDTRFCYLGQRRLEMMEEMLPSDTHVIGIDEHTGLVIDLETETARIVGNGTVTVRTHGSISVRESGSTFPMDALRDPGSGSVAIAFVPTVESKDSTVPSSAASLAQEIEAAESGFDRAIDSRRSDDAVRCILELEEAIHRWSADTLQSDDADRARAVLRSMIVRIGDAAKSGLTDPQTVVGPFVETLLELRTRVRSDKLYDLSDLIRDRLVELGIEVHDTAGGATWELRSAQ